MKNKTWFRGYAACAVALVVGLAACGGGGGGGAPSPSLPSSVSGTAAIGAALAQAAITVVDRSGASVCTNAPVVTDATGAYACTLSAQSRAPFAISVIDPVGLVAPMVSILANKPAAGATTTANVTPLTTAIAAQLDPNKDAFALVNNPGALAGLDTVALAAITTNVVAQLAPVLQALGVDVTTFDPMQTPFVGGSGSGADQLLDQVRVTFDGGSPQLSNVLNPDAPSVPLAGTSTTSVSTVSVSAVTTAFSISELDFAKTELERCFSVPAALRAPNPDTTNRRLRGVASECENFVASAGDAPNVEIDFLHNGYSSEAYFYSLFTSEDMDGAQFNRPELMRYETRFDGRDVAVLNIKFQDKSGFSGNRILIAKKFPGSRPAGTQWWLIGNQRDTDASISTELRRREQTVMDFDTFANAGGGRFDNALTISVRRGNLPSANNPNSGIWYVRVKGPALPPAGLVLADLPAGAASNVMSILRADGVIPTGPQQVNRPASSSAFSLQRTVGLEGTSALTLRANPGAADAEPTTPNFAHPTMYGQPPSSSWQLDVSGVTTWAEYSFEAFDGISSTLPIRTWTSRLVAPLVQATQAVFKPWHGIGQNTTSFLSLGAPAVGSITIDWKPNPLSERVRTVWAQSYLSSSNGEDATVLNEVFSDFVSVPVGAAAALVTAAGSGAQFHAIQAPTTATRIVTFSYSMLDGSSKQQQMFFN